MRPYVNTMGIYMANLFGAGQPVIIVNGTSITLPALPMGGRYEDFRPEVISERRTFRGRIIRKIEWRLYCLYHWPKIDANDLDNIIETLNKPGTRVIKFPAFNQVYEFNIGTNTKRENAGGSELYDAYTLELDGADTVSKFPNLDSLYWGQFTLDLERIATT